MFLVGITCVSAENIDELGTSSSDDVISTDGDVSDTINVESDVSTDSADEVISDSEPARGNTYTWGDFKSEVENTSINTVHLNQGNIAPSTSSSDQISINHDVTIVGGYGYYIGSADWSSAPKYNYIPMITSGNNLNVKFENVTFQYLSNNIFIKLMGNGNYTFKNCIFDHINATGSHQSVIWLNYGQALIENCTFTNCRCSFGAVTNYYSSAPATANYARMTVKDSTFKDNYATTEPGAINNCGYLEVYDTTFENNEAYWWAGAIHTHMYANTTVVRSNFKNNLAGWNGGALYTYSYLRVVNSTFTGNNATTNTGGGAIGASSYGSKPTVIVENSKFEDNTALTGNGGAIVISSGTLTVSDSEFINNAAPRLNGGAISSGSCTATITNSLFKYNSAILGKGGAIYGAGNGRLTVDKCIFVNNTAKDDNSGHAIAYYYTGSSSTAAYLTYINNQFYGPNNGAGSVYASINVNITAYNNTIDDISNYTEPDDNSSGSVVPIPSGTPIGNQVWNASLSGALGGTPLVEGDVIYVANGHSIYCLNVSNGALLWNASSTYVGLDEYNNFHDLALHNGVLVAPCDGDKLYLFNATTGSEIELNPSIIQGSSLYAPLVVGNKIYISSEYAYGVNNESWIAVIEYNNGVYNYTGSILDISGVSYGTHALISAPILWNNYLWVNTINGLVRYNLTTNTYTISVANTVGKPVVGGDYIYVLTADNHICGVNANGNVIKNITVGGNVGNTLAINSDNSVLYTVNAEGYIYRADVSSSTADDINRQINPVSSALTVGSDGYLYIGDDAGILWVINVFEEDSEWFGSIIWAYNVSSSIFGVPIIYNGIVYVGTNDTFYALSNPSNILYLSEINNILSINQKNLLFYNLELLGIDFEEILTDLKEKTIPAGDLSSSCFDQGSNVTYYLDGTYYAGSQEVEIGGTSKKVNGVFTIQTLCYNITIKPKEGSNATIEFKRGNPQRRIRIKAAVNVTLENIKFTGISEQDFLDIQDGVQNVIIRGCTFENMNAVASTTSAIINIFNRVPTQDTKNITFENCNFINCTAPWIFYIGGGESYKDIVDCVSLVNCVFENCAGTYTYQNNEVITITSAKNVHLENNTFINSVPIVFDKNGQGTLDTAKFNILTESLTVGEQGSIVAELVDDKGNHIKSDNLKFIVNDEEKTPTFDPATGLYTFEVTPSDTNDIKFSASCSNVETFDVESIYIKVSKPSSNLTLGDDITFDYGESGSTTVSYEGATDVVAEVVNNTATIKIENGNITVSGLDAGNYTLKVTTVADDDHANVTKTVNITVNKVDCDINIMNPVIYVYGNIGQCSVLSQGVIDFTASIINHTEAIINIDSNGIVNVSGLNVGNYVLEVTANPDKNHNSITRQTNVTVSEAESQITIPNIVFTYGESGSVNATLVGATGITNASVLNHTEAVVNIVNNTITVSGLAAGSYVLQATTIPDANHNPVTATANITVNGVEVPADKAISTNVPANTKSPTFSIKLEKDATGTFTVNIDNGKIVKTAELKDGAASITVADLAAGDHNISISYSGDGKYAPITQNTTLTIKEPVKPTPKVNKKATKIVAKKKTFKAKVKVKKYTITLKSGKTLLKKVKVTLKVKGKTYKATTNKKGKATFKIKNLKKKGTYKAVIKFKGNKNYKATSKKVKIKVKK